MSTLENLRFKAAVLFNGEHVVFDREQPGKVALFGDDKTGELCARTAALYLNGNPAAVIEWCWTPATLNPQPSTPKSL